MCDSKGEVCTSSCPGPPRSSPSPAGSPSGGHGRTAAQWSPSPLAPSTDGLHGSWGDKGTGQGSVPDFGIQLGLWEGVRRRSGTWVDRGGRDRSRQRRLAFLGLIQASSLVSAEVEEPYYTIEFTEAQRGTATSPGLHSM